MAERNGKMTAMIFGAAEPFGREIVTRLTEDGFRVVAADAKVSGSDAAAVDRLIANETSLDALVINRPVEIGTTRFLDISDADFESAMEQKIVEPLVIVQAAVRYMKPGARIVHVTSRAHLGAWGGAHITAAGAAAVTMMRCLALELVNSGIRINVIAPDFVSEVKQSPDGPRQVAAAVSYFAGTASEPTSGHTYLMNNATSLQLRESSRR